MKRGQSLTFKFLAALVLVMGDLKVAPTRQARAEFEDLGTSARIVGLGGAGVAFASDASALFVHPAGLATAHTPGLAAGYRRLHLGLTDSSALWDGFAAYSHHFGRAGGTAAAGWQGFGLLDAYSEQTWAVGYGRTLLERWGVQWTAGAAGMLRRRAVERDAYTDADPLFQARGRGVSAGDLSAGLGVARGPVHAGVAWDRILRPSLSFEPSAERLPAVVRAGIGYQPGRIGVGTDLGIQGRDLAWKAGAEYALLPGRVFLRGGLGLGSRQFRQVTAGIGVAFRGYRLDYAAVFPLTGLRETHYTHSVSALIPLGIPVGPPTFLPGVYLVRPGDTLPSIAASPEIYGDASRWREIYEANKEILGASFELYPDLQLVIPRKNKR